MMCVSSVFLLVAAANFARYDPWFDTGARSVAVDSFETPVEFKPSPTGKRSVPAFVEVEAAFTFVREDDDWFEEGKDARHAGLAAFCPDEGTAHFIGLTKDGHVELFADGLIPEEDVTYTVRFETNHALWPMRVSYLVDGRRLHDANGEEWFVAPRTEPGYTAAVGAIGQGTVGRIRGEMAKPARATLAVARTRPRVGTAVSTPSVTTNEGAALVGELGYRWRSVNWRGDPVGEATDGATYVPKAADYGKWLVAEAYDDNGYAGEGRIWFSRLPVVYIDVADGATPSSAKEEHDATIGIYGNDEYKDQYEGATTIKVRGNTTAGCPKKPYKLKLGKKTDLFGFGDGTKNKHWVLLANYLDESLMRNKLAYDFSANFGLTYMKSTWADVVLNGQYNGCYTVCQHIRVGTDRVDIYDWEDAAGKVAEKIVEGNPDTLTADDEDAMGAMLETDFSWVTSGEVAYGGETYRIRDYWKKYSTDLSGGYLFEFSNEYDELSKFAVTSKTVTVGTMLNKPEYLYTNPEMMAAAKGVLQDFWDACTSSNGYNAAGRHYAELADVDSLVGFWLTVEIFRNSDAWYKSRYASKDQQKPIRFGPVWDFDYAWGGAPMWPASGAEPTATGWCVAQAAGERDLGAVDSGLTAYPGFYKEWSDDPYFCQKLHEAYWRVRPVLAEMVRDGGTIDRDVAYIWESGLANEQKWPYKLGFSGEKGDAKWCKEFLWRRLVWLDEQFTSVEKLMASVKTNQSAAPYTRSDAVAAAFPVSADARSGTVADVAVAKAGDVPAEGTAADAAEIRAYVNGIFAGSAAIAGGTASLRLPSALFTAADGQTNVVAFDSHAAGGAIVARNYAFVRTVSATPVPAVVPETGAAVAVPFEWIAGHYPDVTNNPYGAALPSDYAALANALDENGLSPLGKSVPFSYDYVAGTDPAKPDDFLKATIEIAADGTVTVWVEPDLGDSRVYTVFGKETLDPGEVWKPADENSRFFKVGVSLP